MVQRAGVGLLLWIVGCASEPAPFDPYATCHPGRCYPAFSEVPDQLDVLLVIENTSSMAAAQARLAAQLPRFVHQLLAGDSDGDGSGDFFPPRSLHVGIVDTDMGPGGTAGTANCDVGFGDDGLMQTRLAHPRAGCRSDYLSSYPGRIFDFTMGAPVSDAAYAADVACMTQIGTDGCGFAAPLEAALKAISLTPAATGDSPVSWTHPGYRPPVFFGGTFGHGDDPATNGNFLFPFGTTAVVLLATHDDCSTDMPQIFSLDDAMFSATNINLRCHTFGDRLYPIERYADGLVGLRAAPHELVLSVIEGVPTDLAGSDPAVILADPRMLPRIDPAHADRLVPAESV